MGKSVFESLLARSGQTVEVEVQCCENGKLSSTIKKCGRAVPCDNVCGEKNEGE